MEVVVQTDYQDIYRITDGVLFIVNKFIPVDYSNDTPKKIYLYQSDMKYRLYNKFCQKRLKVLKEDYKNKYCPVVIPKGTVMYMNTPVICTNDKDKWKYELKTTGTAFSWTYGEILKMLDDVADCIDISRKSSYRRN